MLFCEAFRCQVKIWRCLLGDSCENWGSRRVCKLLSGRFHWAIVRPGYFWGWCLLMLLESASLVSRYVGNSKSVLLAKRLFSQEEWVCVLVCSLGSALGVVAWQDSLSSYYSCGVQEHQVLGHPSEMMESCPLHGLYTSAGFSKAVGELKEQDMLSAYVVSLIVTNIL